MPGCWRTVVVFCVVVVVVGAVRLKCRLGELEGARRTTPRTGRPYYAFTSLPYAQPPIGSLRLKNPVPFSNWEGVLDATRRPPICIQNRIFFPKLRQDPIGQEDCLYLNIYSPTLNPLSKLPVLVFIHGGGFRSGHPVQDEGAETNFMEEDVILVTVHYRLGILGFLSTEDSEIPGNFGLKDQTMAIKWVYENIEAFGGDPLSITAFGGSSGAASVHYLITSPISRDFLKGGISQSGVLEAAWALAPRGKARRLAHKVAEIVGCNVTTHLLKCLQETDAMALQQADMQFLVWDFDPGVIFQPVLEPKGDDAFLTADPRKIESTKAFLTGVNTGEGFFKTGSLFHQDSSLLDEFINNVDHILPYILFLEPDIGDISEYISIIKEKYFNDLSSHKKVLEGLQKLVDDIFFYPAHIALLKHKGPKYGYIFDHTAETSLVDLRGPEKMEIDRPCHGDELLSLFNWTSSFPNKKGREEDRQMSIRLVKLWTNFAKYQNPTPGNSEFSWDQFESDNLLFLSTYDNKMVRWPYDNITEFWEKANKILEHSGIKKDEL